MKIAAFLPVSLSFLAVLATGCGSPIPSETSQGSNNPDGSGAYMEYPEGWEQVSAITNGAEISLSGTGHYTTSRNACTYNTESGAATIQDWNELARNLNAAMKLTPLAEEKCFESLTGPFALDNFAEVKTAGGKRPIFEVRGNETCTKIPDPALAKAILVPLNRIFNAAQTEGCPSTPAY